MTAAGYKPFKDPNADKCDGGSTCFPETESCAGTGLGNCNFLWKKGQAVVVVGTVGDPPTVEGVGKWTRR